MVSWKSRTRMVSQSTMRIQVDIGQSGNTILTVMKSTMRVQVDFGKSMNTILKAAYYAAASAYADADIIYFENSDGEIEENRPYPKSIEIDGIKYKLTKL